MLRSSPPPARKRFQASHSFPARSSPIERARGLHRLALDVMLNRSVRATRAEAGEPLPGDQIIPNAIGSLTHAVTIRRPPHEVWPWLAQMGAGSRAGWYSYDLLDNEGHKSARGIRPELQALTLGMVFPALPGATDGFTLLSFEPERFLVLGWSSPDGPPLVTWAFVLREANGRTRLIVRARGGPGYAFHGLPPRISRRIVRLVHFIMQRRQLIGIAARAEGLPAIAGARGQAERGRAEPPGNGRTSHLMRMAAWSAAGAGLAAGAYAVYAGLTWWRFGRVPRAAKEDADRLLDRFMPTYDVVDRHHIRVQAPAAMTLAAARELDLFHLPVVRAVIRGRELLLGARPDDRPRPRGLLAETQSLGWVVLAEQPGREVVVGAVTKPWEPEVTFRSVPPDQFASFAEPDYVKIAWTLRADRIDDRASIFRTETRVVATDAGARAKFRRYWSYISPGIKLIRRVALRPVKSVAERRARGSASRGDS